MVMMWKVEGKTKPIVVLYTSDTCPMCSDVETEFSTLPSEHSDILFIRLEIHKPRESCIGFPGSMMGPTFKGTPTIYFFQNQKIIHEVVGAGKMEEVKSKIQEIETTIKSN
jgi:protein-disulfide isomerase